MVTFSHDDTFAKIADLIAQKQGVDKSRVTPQATLNDLSIDSLDLVQIIMKLEEQFGLEINDDDAAKLCNIGQVVEYIHARRTK